MRREIRTGDFSSAIKAICFRSEANSHVKNNCIRIIFHTILLYLASSLMILGLFLNILLIIKINKNNTAVISFKSDASIPILIAMDIQALYIIEPNITADVAFTNLMFFNSLVPMITLARPITIVPVPDEISKKPFI